MGLINKIDEIYIEIEKMLPGLSYSDINRAKFMLSELQKIRFILEIMDSDKLEREGDERVNEGTI